MGVRVCSLISTTPQLIPADGGYHLLRFPPYPSESYDAWAMHQMAQPDGYQITAWATDDRSGLIWPAAPGWGVLTAVIRWASGPYTEVRDQYVRDPLGLTPDGPDTTCTQDHAMTPGGQYLAKHHEIFVNPATPLGIAVRHNAPLPVAIDHCQFKLAIHDVDEPAA